MGDFSLHAYDEWTCNFRTIDIALFRMAHVVIAGVDRASPSPGGAKISASEGAAI
jgi:hypothetical protein